MRHRGILALGLLVLPLAGCAPLPETLTWQEWAASEGFAAYDGSVVGASVSSDGMTQYQANDRFYDLPTGAGRIDLLCRSQDPVTFEITGAEPVVVDCAEGGSVEVAVTAGTLVQPSTPSRAYWLAVARADAEAIGCEDCEVVEPGVVRLHEADAFVDGEPVDGSDEAPSEP